MDTALSRGSDREGHEGSRDKQIMNAEEVDKGRMGGNTDGRTDGLTTSRIKSLVSRN